VGTDGDGLDRIKKKTFTAPENLAPVPAQSICGDGQDGLWIAFNARGVTHWRTNSAQHYEVGGGQSAWALLVDQQQQVWAGTSGEGLFLLQNDAFRPAPLAVSVGPADFYAV